MLGEELSVTLFTSMFIVYPTNKGNSDKTYALSGTNREVKGKFTSSLSKVHDCKVNFVVVRRQADLQTSDDAFDIWSFTTHWGEIFGN